MALMSDDRSLSMSSNHDHDPWGSSRPFKRRRIWQNKTPALSSFPSPICASRDLIENDHGLQEVQECGDSVSIQPLYERGRPDQTQVETPKPVQEDEEEVCFGMVSTT